MHVHLANTSDNLAKHIFHSLTFSEDGVLIFIPQLQLKELECRESYIFLLQGFT